MITQNQKWSILIILCWIYGVVSMSIRRTIDDDVSFYYEELPVPPSLSIEIYYEIQYPLANSNDYVDVQLYTTSEHENIGKKCSFRKHSQFYNLRMYYRCRQLECKGSVPLIKDYIPRKFLASIGFDCEDASKKSLKNTIFFVNVYYQSNVTYCFTVPETIVNCSRFYSFASAPNLLGQLRDLAPYWIKYLFDTLHLLEFPLHCYAHLEESVCHIYFPRCEDSSTVIVPCQETYDEMHKGCATSSVENEALTSAFFASYHNKYFPPRDGAIPCFYKPVICGPPPNATDIVITGGFNDSGIYYGGSELKYSCADDSLVISEPSTVTCLYSGFWSPLPVCSEPERKYLLKILLPVLSFGLCVLVVAMVVIICTIRRRKKAAKNLLLMRKREFDAFVCYDFDGNDDFVLSSILPALEENQDPPFKLCIHSRDFEPGVPIFDNIQSAVSRSNSAIIIMSQEFVNSMWCKKEFQHCFIENMNDPAFKLFLIMMQPADSLEGLTKCMTSFIAEKTYLERHDPDLIGKLSQYLTWIKQPKEDRKEGMIELTDMSTA